MTHINFEELKFDLMLNKELDSRTRSSDPPSLHIQAYRDYERQKFAVLGRNPHPRHMAYNLITDAVDGLHWAHSALTMPSFMKSRGFTRKTAPQKALHALAESIGYRYMRGLESIEHRLKANDLRKFRMERQRFRWDFETHSDAAFLAKSHDGALEAVRRYADELQALCPWLVLVGQEDIAHELLNCLQFVGAPQADQLFPSKAYGRIATFGLF